MAIKTTIGLFVLLAVVSTAITANPPPCDSDIYCYGDILKTVQMAAIYPDSKTFVDMKLKNSKQATLTAFNQMMTATNNNPSNVQIETFVNNTFDPPNTEFETWEPTDFVASPKFLTKIKDLNLRKFAKDIVGFWKVLGRKIKKDVKDNPWQYSLIYLENPFIVPGGRFREIYYWDSYWIVRGLLLSEMTQTVKGMLSNLLSLVDRLGFVPNGGRIYYSMRSQPPLLASMVDDYFSATGDKAFIAQNIHLLEKEYNFWVNNRSVTVWKDFGKYQLFQYAEESDGPRPESYREDVLSAKNLNTLKSKNQFYSEIKSAAESGWDFSSRWFIKDKTNKGDLSDLKTKSIVPVDLNAIMYKNLVILSHFCYLNNMFLKSAIYHIKAKKLLRAIDAVFYNEEIGAWLDYDLDNKISRNYFYPSNLSPIWTKAYNPLKRTKIIKAAAKYLDNNVDSYLGGIPTSLDLSKQQWDLPNSWPPLVHYIIAGFQDSEVEAGKDIAKKWAQRWVKANYLGYTTTNEMFEKYDAVTPGAYGGGGEYNVQVGFGWTNGAVLDICNRYGDILTS